VKRRNFLILAGAGAGAAAVGTTYWYINYYEPPYAKLLAEPTDLSRLWDEATLRRIGTAYRAQVPGEAGEEVLLQYLTAFSATGKPDAAALQAAVQRDFSVGNTILLDGWVLSVTEARQCALYSLANL
jgi:hypothetical protein